MISSLPLSLEVTEVKSIILHSAVITVFMYDTELFKLLIVNTLPEKYLQITVDVFPVQFEI